MSVMGECCVTDGSRALVVDDEPAMGEIMSHVLEQMGYEVDRALDGDQALVLGRSQRYDVVVCDLLMPRVNGMALYEAWREEAPEMARRVIFVTGDNMGTQTAEFVTRTGCRCIYKPFRLSDLATVVSEVRQESPA